MPKFASCLRQLMKRLRQYTIPYKGLGKGIHEFEFEIDNSLFDAFENSEIKGGSAHVRVELERAVSAMTLKVNITGAVTVECDRCLDDLELPVEYKDTFQVKFSDEERDFDGEVMWLNPVDDYVELGQYLYESILLSLPYIRVHEEDENGDSLCNAEMLARFKRMSPEEFDKMMQENNESALASNPELEKLRKLMIDVE